VRRVAEDESLTAGGLQGGQAASGLGAQGQGGLGPNLRSPSPQLRALGPSLRQAVDGEAADAGCQQDAGGQAPGGLQEQVQDSRRPNVRSA
jgi:hypothetical protein